MLAPARSWPPLTTTTDNSLFITTPQRLHLHCDQIMTHTQHHNRQQSVSSSLHNLILLLPTLWPDYGPHYHNKQQSVSSSLHNSQNLHWSHHGPQTTTQRCFSITAQPTMLALVRAWPTDHNTTAFLHHCTTHKTCTGQVWPQIMTTTVFFHQCTTHNACTGQIMAHNTTVFLHHRTAHKTCTGQIWPQIMTTTQQGFSITAQPTTLALARSWPTDHNRQQTVFLHHCTTHNAYILWWECWVICSLVNLQ